MRTRTLLALTATAGATATLLALAPTAGAQPTGSAARTATCKESALTVKASAADKPGVLRVSVTNRGDRTCVVDRIPTVTFGALDGAAQPVPATESAPYRVGAGRTAYAAVRTVADPGDTDARLVDFVTVAGDPSHRGRQFTDDKLGLPQGVRVWEPVTTWWQPSRAKADAALEHATR
ncbi:DUF4232 domain-containing protein [Streptomyces sp. NPDC059063]|uniref:DUF4232 domain-containing protein n=1 Tax=unclassified Streptomyces TaxID=2593676 RepID=UPI00368CF335